MKNGPGILLVALVGVACLWGGCAQQTRVDIPRRVLRRGQPWRIYRFTRISKVYRAALASCKIHHVEIAGELRNKAINGELPRSWTGGAEVIVSFTFDSKRDREVEGKRHSRVEVKFYNVPAGGNPTVWAGRLLQTVDDQLGI